MHFAYDLAEAEMIIRDLPVGSASLIAGQALTHDVGSEGMFVLSAGATGADILGVAQEASTTASNIRTGALYNIKVCINPLAVWKAVYNNSDTDIDVSSAASNVVTLGSADSELAGSYMYANSGTGIGQLRYIGQSTTTAFTPGTTYGVSWTTTLDSSTDVLLIRRPRVGTSTSVGQADLDDTYAEILSDESVTGAFALLNNYINGPAHAMETLTPPSHGALNGLNNGTRFWGDLYPTDHLLKGATTWTTAGD